MKLRIDKAVYGGAGLARIPEGPLSGKTVFVPMTLPGELVEAHIISESKTFANAELDSILEPSPTRTTPPCPYYGGCGGCHYQHATYAQQLEMKSAILSETLQRACVLTNSAAPITTLSREPWNYRNRIRLQVRPASADRPAALCYRERGSHNLLAVDQCPIAAPVLVRALGAIRRLPASDSIDKLCDEIELFTNSSQDAVLLSLTTSGISRTEAADLQQFCQALKSDLPELQGATLFASNESLAQVNKSNQAKTNLATWGNQYLTYKAAGSNYHVSTGSFFQVNRDLIDDLAELVTQGFSGNLAWDLYAGVGLFSLPLTRNFKLVRAVESAPSSCADLRYNLQGAAHKIVESTTLDFLRLQAAAKPSPRSKLDLVVVDPPRAGLGAEVTTLLSRIAPRDIVYVSCDPATLARDLRALVQSGYKIQTITMVDLFPQTFHLESVSRLSLR